jgi:mannose-6-phosphate isomerase-like protein (cupin superfamily)
MPAQGRETAEHYVWGDVCDGWRLLSREDLSVIEERIPPGHGEVSHFHTWARQLFYVLSGRLAIDMPDESVEAGPGQSFEVAPGIIHRVHNPFGDDVALLVISSPTTAGDRTNIQ